MTDDHFLARLLPKADDMKLWAFFITATSAFLIVVILCITTYQIVKVHEPERLPEEIRFKLVRE